MYWISGHISKCLLYFVLGKYSVNCSLEGKPTGDDKWARENSQIRNIVLHWYFGDVLGDLSVNETLTLMVNYFSLMHKPYVGY